MLASESLRGIAQGEGGRDSQIPFFFGACILIIDTALEIKIC